jgi:hypothetical protein
MSWKLSRCPIRPLRVVSVGIKLHQLLKLAQSRASTRDNATWYENSWTKIIRILKWAGGSTYALTDGPRLDITQHNLNRSADLYYEGVNSLVLFDR